MKDQTTINREMHPPIIFVECPHDGHLWPKVNHRWTDAGKQPIRFVQWCPDHQVEKEIHRSAAIRAAKAEADKRYAAMPLPEAKMCRNPSPTAHREGAVLPRSRFYRVKGKYGPRLDSRCKECRREETRNRRVSKEQRRAWQAAYRERRRKRRREFEREPDKRLDIGPIHEWFSWWWPVSGWDDMAQFCRAAEIDEALARRILEPGDKRYVSLSVVDRIGLKAGVPSLVDDLYPPPLELEEAA